MQSSQSSQAASSTVVMPKLPTAAMRDIFLQVFTSSGDFDSAFSAMRAVAPECAEPAPALAAQALPWNAIFDVLYELRLAPRHQLEEAARKVADLYTAMPADQIIAWVRFRSDGGYEGPIMDSDPRMDGVRRTSGAWTALSLARTPATVSVDMDAADIRLCRVHGKIDDGEPCAQCKPSGVCVHSGPCGYQKSADIEPLPIDDRIRTAKKLRYYGEVTPGCPDNPTRKLMRHAAELLTVSVEPVASQAAIDVLAERQRQIEVEGWSPEHDDSHDGGEMSSAAAAYSMLAAGGTEENALRLWPWEKRWLKPGPARQMLVKATALNLAEIERLDRAAAAGLQNC